MNGIRFAIWLSGFYCIYYLGIILWDLARGSRTPAGPSANELTFSEHVQPVRLEMNDGIDGRDSPMISSGGVSLQQLFRLAREEAIEYIRPVSF